MCLTKSPRKISGLHCRTCHSICFAVGDSLGKTPSISGCRRGRAARVGAASAEQDGSCPAPSKQGPTCQEGFGPGSQRMVDCLVVMLLGFW